MNRFIKFLIILCGIGGLASGAYAQASGGIRGMVYDQDFDAPLALAEVMVAETGQKVQASAEGNYVISGLQPGTYTLVVSKEGYTRKVFADVVVPAGSMRDQDAYLAGEFTDMEEFVVQDLNMGGASEEGLLNLRMEAPALMDSVGADLMSKAGASDAAQALTLVPGTTIQDGKYAVVRGLPDRYVNSQMNGVRLPSADPDKRAVQLDQFPSAMIESIQVSKTFTPDQQGDASGGAVNIVLKGIPDERVLKVKVGTKYKTNIGDAGSDFLVNRGVELSTWGHDAESIKAEVDKDLVWDGAVGPSRSESQPLYDWSITAGDKFDVGSDFKVGFIGALFYKRDASHYEDGVDDKYWLSTDTRSPYYLTMTPTASLQYQTRYDIDGDGVRDVTPRAGQDESTSLFDVTKGVEELQWGALGGVGLQTENHQLNLIYSYNFSAESVARSAEDTRGKDFFFDGYRWDDPHSPGSGQTLWPGSSREVDYSGVAPYRRVETLDYIERIAGSLQLNGKHTIPIGERRVGSIVTLKEPVFDWTIAKSESTMDTPDRRSLETTWYVDDNGDPIYNIDTTGSFNTSLMQRGWREVEETSDQYFYNINFPFSVWNGEDGFLKFGVFEDHVERRFDQQSYTLDFISGFTPADYRIWWNQSLSELLGRNDVIMKEYLYDISYDAEQGIEAWYYMGEFPVFSFFKITGGARFEDTDISTTLRPDSDQTTIFIKSDNFTGIKYKDADKDDFEADIKQSDILPSIGFEFTPLEKVTIRGSYTETTARMTFKELTPVQQVENVGDDVFIGNPDLQMSALKNYDLRVDYNPYPGGLVSVSWFRKKIKDVIDYRQVLLGGEILATTSDNYPEGELQGYEFEVRQSLGEWWSPLAGLSVGGNLTVIESKVDATPELENLEVSALGLSHPEIIKADYNGNTRDMMGAPEYLYNLNATYTVPKFGTELGLFYTVKGDSLKAAGTQDEGNWIPHVYEKKFASLNFSLSQKLGENWKLGFKAKNLLNPEIQTVYRSNYNGGDVAKTSYTKGREFSISLSYEF
jgi:outer membrane receptor protein involved in Fe transport